MKKIFLGLALVVGFTAVAATAGTKIEQLNQAIVSLLTPFQNEKTKATVVFNDIKTNATNTLNLDVEAFFSKLGTHNKITISLKPISYNYGNGETPTVVLQGQLGADLTKLIRQEDFNALVPDLDKTIEQYAKDLSAEYGDSVKVVAKVTGKTKDAEGNFTGVKGYIEGKLNLAKLPEGKVAEEIILTQGKVEIDFSLSQGASLSLQVVLNPKYKGFQDDESSMKSYLDKLLAQDPKLLAELRTWIERLDAWTTDLVEQEKP